MKNRIAVYAGTFDVFTNGHLHILSKAASLFDEIYVVIADNPDKKCLFTLQERNLMAQEALATLAVQSPANIFHVVKLPAHQYLVDFANHLGATTLIRGIRDNIDFAYEEKLYRTNRTICNKVEAVYIMPDDSHNLISSSWVKSLIGQNGWRDVVWNAVPAPVLEELKKWWFKKEVEKIYQEANSIARQTLLLEMSTSFVQIVVEAYAQRNYHNYDHILDGFEIFNTFLLHPGLLNHLDEKGKLTLRYAWLMHDYVKDEETSLKDACQMASMLDWKKISNYIRATQHSEDFKFEDNSYEAVFASVDLAVLARNYSRYQKYVEKVREEYKYLTAKEWMAGRTKFLESMLAKKVIFPYLPFEEEFGARARNNLTNELNTMLANWKEH